MISTLWETFLRLVGNSGFYFVPIGTMFVILGLKALKADRQRQSFLLLALPLLVLYIFFGNSSSRYLFIPLLLIGCLAGAGVENLANYLRKLPYLKKIPVKYFILVFALAAVISGFLRLSLRTRDTYIREMAGYLRQHAVKAPITLYSIGFSQGRKLGGELIVLPDVEFFHFEQWTAALPVLAEHQCEKRNIFAAVRVPAAYPESSIISSLRSKFYIAPFDLVYSVKTDKYHYLILKFNYRTLDGRQRGFRNHLLAALPETLSTTPYKQWEVFDPQQYLDFEHIGGLTPTYGTNIGNRAYFRRLYGELPDLPTLELRNELGFLEGVRSFEVKSRSPLPPEPQKIPEIGGGLPANVPPLVLQLGKVIVPKHWQYLHLSNLVPLWRYDQSNRIAFSCGSERISNQPGSRDGIRITDRVFDLSTSLELSVEQIDLTELKNASRKVLLINDPFSKNLHLQSHFTEMWNSLTVMEMDIPSAGENSMVAARWAELPAGKIDAVLLNVFSDAFARPWTIPVQIDPFLDEHLSALTEKIRQQYPDTPLLLVMPPPHAAGDTMYSMNNSSLLTRIAWYHIFSAVYRWHQRSAAENIIPVPAALGIDPQTDYILHSPRENIRSGYAFTPAGEKKIAEVAAAYLVFMLQRH